MSRNVYTVEYKLHSAGKVNFIDVIASNKAEVYDEAYWIAIPNKEHEYAYSAWTASVTYQNGNHRRFNTHEGKPY